MESRDLIHALRLWLPDGKSVAGVRQDLARSLEMAFAEFQRTVPGTAVPNPADVFPVAATAVGRGLLQETVRTAKAQPDGHVPSEQFRSTLAGLEWADLLLAAACAEKNDAANRRSWS